MEGLFKQKPRILFFRKIQILIFAISGLFFTNFSFAQQIPVEEGQVYVCPLAKSMEEVNPRCDCRIDLILGETVTRTCPKHNQTYQMTLVITEYEGKEYYIILGFENGGAGVNLRPIAKISGKFEGRERETLYFSASNSSDPNGDPLDFYWEFGDGNTSKGENVSHSYSFAGNYILKLIVDDGLASSTATATITIRKREIPKGSIILGKEIQKEKEEIKEEQPPQLKENQPQVPPRVKGVETREKEIKEPEKKEIKEEEKEKEKERIEIPKAETKKQIERETTRFQKIPPKTKILLFALPISLFILLFLLRAKRKTF